MRQYFKARMQAIAGGLGRGLAIMTVSERRRAVLLVITALFHGLLQTAVLIGVVGVVQWTVNPQQALPQWAAGPIGELFGDVDRATLSVAMGVLLLLLIVFKAVFSWMQSGWLADFSASCEVRLSSFLMRRVLFVPYSWLAQQNSSRLRQLLFGFVSVWSRDFIRALMRMMNDFILTVFIIATLIWSQPIAGLLVALVGGFLGGAMLLVVRPRLRRLAATKRAGILAATKISTECILGVKDVKMAAAELHFANLFDQSVRTYAGADSDGQQWAQFPRHVVELIVYAALVCAGMYVGLAQEQNSNVAGILLLYGLAALRLLPLLTNNVTSVSNLISAFPVIADLEKLIDDTKTSEDIGDDGEDFVNWQEVSLDHVTMRYGHEGRTALRNVSIKLRRGGMYGCVGRSAAGKSTFIDVLSGLMEPSEGAVLIDGKPLPAQSRRSWRKRFSYVAQRPFLLDGTLRDNIVFDGGVYDEKKMARVIDLARLGEVIARSPRGLKTQVGEQGGQLSGGERQRVAIARALYRGAELIILDEATSSLDVIVEHEISETLENLRNKVTLIIVSHRLSLVRETDEIFVFEDGAITERGPHEELMRTSNLYKQMVMRTQSADAA